MSHKGPVYRPSEPSPNDMRWAILRHDVPGEGWHLDLLLARPDADSLVTFRIVDPAATDLLRGARPWSRTAARLPDHRAVYLDYEGAISGGRGSVSRLASGALEWLHAAEGSLRVRLNPLGILSAERTGPTWNLSLDSLEPDASSPNLGR